MTVVIVEDNARVRRLLRHAVAGIASAVWEWGDVVLMESGCRAGMDWPPPGRSGSSIPMPG